MSDARKLKFTSRKTSTGQDANFPSALVNPGIAKSDFHINNLLSKFTDVARPNLFKVAIIPPASLDKDWDSNGEGLMMVLAKSTKIPSVTNKEVVIERSGIKIPFPSNSYDFGDVSITFYCDSNYDIRALFNRWQKWGCADWNSNGTNDLKDSISGQVIIYQYNYDLVPVYAVKLIHAWPSNISEIDLDQDSENAIATFTVDFKYTYQDITMVEK